MGQVWGMAAVALLALAPLPATTADETRQLDEVIVEEDAPGEFADFAAWDREVRDGLERGKLKQRAELTAHDHAQILILEQEMPVLKRALAEIKLLVRAHKFRQTLTHREIQQLAKAYEKAEAILENIPDALMPRCRQLRQYDRRNKATTCEIDYFAIERQLDELRRKQGKQGAAQEIARHGAAAPVVPDVATPFIRVASSPRPRGPGRVHVQADYFRLRQPRVAFSGDAMLTREDFHAIATELPELVPAHALRLELPTGTGMSLGAHDRLKVIGHVSIGEEIARVVLLPRAAAIGYGVVVRADGTIDGTLVAFEYGWSDRRRLAPVNGLRATVLPADARLLPQYQVDAVMAEEPFVRYDIVFVGVSRGKIVLDLRRYDAPAPGGAADTERFEFAAAAGRISIAGMEIDVREIEAERIKFVVHAAAPATHALAAAAP